ncbi:MAG: peptidylprolyl isomerase [Alphaproteobacteria bacterium]
MTDTNGFRFFQGRGQSGNGALITLAVVAVLALGGLAYYAGVIPGTDKVGDQRPAVERVAEAMQGKTASELTEPAPPPAGASTDPAQAIKPGNPTVAKVDGQEIKRDEVLGFIQTLPTQTRQLPLEQLFPLAVNQVVNAKIINEKSKDVKLDNDPEVQAQMELAKNQIVRGVWLQKMVNEKVTEDRLKKDYDTYLKNFPKVEEVKAQHILVKDETKAKDLINQLNNGADFAELAKANSTDATASNGGQLGYFAQAEVVPEFGKVAFSTAPGSYTKEPVKTEFGFHIIKVEEKRQRPPAEFAAAKPFLEAQARREELDAILTRWQKEGNIERYDINGDPVKVEPAAGQ